MAPSLTTFLLLLLLLLSLPFVSSSSIRLLNHSPSAPKLFPADEQALLALRKSLHDLPGSTFFSTWNFSSTSDPCSDFAGVFCSSSDEDNGEPRFLRVSALTLGTGLSDSPGLGGSLPPSIANLTALAQLVIFSGQISGPIPPELGLGLRRLRLLSISDNRILGPIPATLSGLHNLHTLDLSQNQLQGPVPSAIISSNPSLKILILAANGGLCGDLPSELSAAAQLLHLDLHGNSFTGSLPPLPSTLRYLSVAFNSMSGQIAPASNLPDLQFLDLSGNTFSGKVPPAIFSLPQLSSILLQRNNLSGPLHLPLASAAPRQRWALVDLSHNLLSGEAPAGLAAAGSLYLNDNQLTGPLPRDYIGSVCNGTMSTLYAQRNFLTSLSLPPPPASPALPATAVLCLSYNCVVSPAAATSGCPVNSRVRQPRPANQCASAAGAGGG